MANKKKTEDQFAQVEQALTKTEQYIEDNQKSLCNPHVCFLKFLAF